ncbi:MAG: TolC family protein [Bacteroidota bacterium]
MKMMFNFLVYTGASIVLCSQLMAQTSHLPLLTLSDAVTQALANNDDLKTLRYDKEYSQNSIDPAKAGKRPTVDFSGNLYYGYADGRAQTAGLGGPEESPPIELSGVRHGLSAQVEAAWVVFDGGKGNNILEGLRLIDEATAIQLTATREQVVAQVTNTYLRVAQLYEQLALEERNIGLTQARLERVARAEELGTSSSLRRLQVEVDLRSDSIAYQNTLLEVQNAKRSLNLLIGQAVDIDFVTASLPDADPVALDLAALQADLLANNENLAQARHRIKQSSNEIKRIDLGSTFNVQAYARNSYLNTTDNSNFLQENRNFGPEIGVRISRNIFDGGARKVDAQNAQIRLEQSRHQLEATQRTLLNQLRQAYATYDNNRLQLATERTNLATFQTNYDKTLEDYRLGQTDGLTVRTAQNNLNAALTRINLRRYGVRSSEVEILRLTGTLVK